MTFSAENPDSVSRTYDLTVYLDEQPTYSRTETVAPGATFEESFTVSADQEQDGDGQIDVIAQIETECQDSTTTSETVRVESDTTRKIAQDFRVVDSSGERLGNVLVRGSGQAVRTDSLGRATLDLERNREHTIRFSKSGYETETKTIIPSTRTVEVVMRRESSGVEARLDVTPDPAGINERITFYGRGSRNAERYYFDFTNDGVFDVVNSDGIAKRSFGTAGTRTAKLKVENSAGEVSTDTETYEVKSTSETCKIESGFLRLSRTRITEDESSEARINVYNDGDRQDVRVTFRVDGVQVSRSTRSVSGSETFSATVSPDEDATVSARVETRGGPCGDRLITTSYEDIDVVQTRDDATLVVNVQDSEGLPLQDARVTADNRIERTDSNGRVELSLESGSYTVEASKDRYSSDSEQVRLSSGERRTVSLTLVRENRDGALTVRTEDSSGDVISGARIDIENGEEESGFTDSDGEFQTRLSPGSYQVAASRSGFSDASTTATISSGESRTVVLEMSRLQDPVEKDAELDVHVETVGGQDVQDARVSVEGPEIRSERTDFRGDAGFVLEPGRYSVTVEKSGYRSATKEVRLQEGDRRNLNFVLRQRDRLGDKATLDVRVEDSTGSRIQGASVTVENSDRFSEATGRDGKAVFLLDPDRYDVRASKTGYTSDSRSVRLFRGDSRSVTLVLRRRFVSEGLSIEDVGTRSTVCEGSDVKVSATVSNSDFRDTVVLEASGLGERQSKSFTLDRDDRRTETLTLRNVQRGQGDSVTVKLSGRETVRQQETVRVIECDTAPGDGSGDIDARLSVQADPPRIDAGRSTRISGYLDGVDSRRTVRITADGRRIADTRTDGSGFYQTYYTPDKVGNIEIRARAAGRNAVTMLKVDPYVDVSSIDAPEVSIESDQLQVCGSVESPTRARAVLEENGQPVQTRYGTGEICFTRSPSTTGEVEYTIRAVAQDSSDSESTTVNVQEDGPEVTSFPDSVTSVRSGDGIVRIDLYNTADRKKTYRAEMSQFPDGWFASSQKELVLSKGERGTIFFYVTPKAEGDFTAKLEVSADGSQVYSDDLRVKVGGTNTEYTKSFRERLDSAFSILG